MAKKIEVDVKLVFRYTSSREIQGVADCRGYITPTQIVITSGTVISGKFSLGGLPYRFYRMTGLRVGRTGSGWSVDHENLKQLRSMYPITPVKDSEEP